MVLFARRLTAIRLAGLGLITTILLVTYKTYDGTLALPARATIKVAVQDTCTPAEYSDGQWERKHDANLTRGPTQSDVLNLAGFHDGCASSREYWWHLGADDGPRMSRFPDVTSYEWTPRSCAIRPLVAEDFVRDLVELGGWLLIGDSITEGHFFSMSCMLSPYVRTTPFYAEGQGFERDQPQNMYLKPDSPLIARLNLPKDFDIENTPLVTFRREDLLLTTEKLQELHKSWYNPPDDFVLWKSKAYTLGPEVYMPQFLNPALRYSTLVVSSAGHWEVSTFAGFRDETKDQDRSFGTLALLGFFEKAMKVWAKQVNDMLTADRNGAGAAMNRRVVVRSYLPGHDGCHEYKKPWTKDLGPGWPNHQWNWPWIHNYNEILEKTVDEYSDIHYLGIDHPARLRPESHVNSDCLHIMAGAGVLEGWSHYIWHYVTREIPRLTKEAAFDER